VLLDSQTAEGLASSLTSRREGEAPILILADILDSALLRPGRIDRKIEFPPPNPEARITILKIHSRKVSNR
jgi:ATP-dependent Zn protease